MATKSNFSYMAILKLTFKMLLGTLMISILLFFWKKSYEASLGVFIFLSSFVILNMISQLLNEFHIKHRPKK